MILLYNISLHILLLYLVINITVLDHYLLDTYSTTIGLLFFKNIII